MGCHGVSHQTHGDSSGWCEVWEGIWVSPHRVWALAALWVRLGDLQELGMLMGMTFGGLHLAFLSSPWCSPTGTHLSYFFQQVGGGSL